MLERSAPIPGHRRDYSLLGRDAELAVERGLAAADWYHTDVPRKRMKELMARRDGPALRDTAIWLGLLAGFAFGAFWFWGGWLCVPFFLAYGVLYGSASDSRWHEAGHGTAFRTQWMNDVVYQLASFMNMKEPTLWRWSHARHHTDTIIVGRDREIAAMRPPDVLRLVLNIVGIADAMGAARSVARHAAGRLTAEEATFIPETERRLVYREARAWVGVYAAVIATAIYTGSVLPLLYIGLPSLYGRWLALYLGLHPARRAGGERSRPPPQLAHGVHESGAALHLLEHELPRRAPYVPDGPLPRAAARCTPR